MNWEIVLWFVVVGPGVAVALMVLERLLRRPMDAVESRRHDRRDE